jgi:anti-sigma-K factor RskA
MSETADRAHPDELLVLHAVGALDAAEDVIVRDHLESCDRCQHELDAYRETLARLISDRPAPAGLWERLSARVEELEATRKSTDARPSARPSGHVPATSLPMGSAKARRRLGLRVLAAAAAVVVAAAAAAAVVHRDDRDDRDDRVTVADLAGSVEGATGAKVVALHAAESGDVVARVIVAPDDIQAYVLVDDLQPLEPARSYQLWSTGTAGEPVSLAVLGDGRSTAIPVPVPPGTRSFAISEEPAGGSVHPSDRVVAVGQV